MDPFDPEQGGVVDIGRLRGAEFGRLLRHPITILGIVVGAVIGGAVGQWFGPIPLVLGALVIPTFVLLLVRLLAGRRASKAFFVAWAGSRGFSPRGEEDLDRVVPLLGKGHRRRVEESFSGTLAPGLDGVICLFNYTTTSGTAESSSEIENPFTVVLTEVEETRSWMPELLVWKKSGPRAFEKLEDRMRRDHERVTPPNEVMGKRYEVFVRKGQDLPRAAGIFSPTFVSWLTTTPPRGFAFELVDGWLCAYLPKYRTTSEELDGLVAWTGEVAQRLREESRN